MITLSDFREITLVIIKLVYTSHTGENSFEKLVIWLLSHFVGTCGFCTVFYLPNTAKFHFILKHNYILLDELLDTSI